MAKSLATTVATPSKWPGRARPSQPSLDPVDRHRGRQRRRPVRVHLGHRRRQHRRDAVGLGTARQVGLQGPRVVVDVVGVAELQRVDEDGDGHEVALGRRPRHQRAVARRAARPWWGRARRCARRPGPRRGRGEPGGRVEDLHGARLPPPRRRQRRRRHVGRAPRTSGTSSAGVVGGPGPAAGRLGGPRTVAPAGVGQLRRPGRPRRCRPGARRGPGRRGGGPSVAQSPRAAGPVRAPAGPRPATSSTAARVRPKKASSGEAGRGRHPLHLAQQGHHVVGGDAGRGVVGGPVARRPPRPPGRPGPRPCSRATGSPATAKVTPGAQAARRRSSGLGSGTSGCRAARRGWGASTSRPSEPDRWSTTVEGVRVARPAATSATASSGVAMTSTSTPWAAPGEVVAAAQDPGHVPAARRQRTTPGNARPARGR